MAFKVLAFMDKLGLTMGKTELDMFFKMGEFAPFRPRDRSPERWHIAYNGQFVDVDLWRQMKHVFWLMPIMPFLKMDQYKCYKDAIDFHDEHWREELGEYECERSEITEEELEEFESYCKDDLGVCNVGYTRLKNDYVFQDSAVLFDKAIVLTMEMDRDYIEQASHPNTSYTVMKTYRDLGVSTMKASEYLQDKGFGTMSAHPLDGNTLTPPLAVHAGLGWQGQHGIVITPEFGPCVRISAVYTNIENLPFFEDKVALGEEEYEHRWIEEFCETCHNCVRKCPMEAILEEKIYFEEEMNLGQCIDVQKCFPEFVETVGCSVCIKECMFFKLGYESIKKKFMKREQAKEE